VSIMLALKTRSKVRARTLLLRSRWLFFASLEN